MYQLKVEEKKNVCIATRGFQIFNLLIPSLTRVTCAFSYRVPNVCNRGTCYCAKEKKRKGEKQNPENTSELHDVERVV